MAPACRFQLPKVNISDVAARTDGNCALSYNLFRHRAVAVAAYLLGGLLALPFLSLVGVLLLGHASFDRLLGLGFQDASSPGPAPLKPGGQSA